MRRIHYRPRTGRRPANGTTRRGSRGRPRRRGAVTLELILTLPIWLILLLAIIEFGQLLSNQQQVALAGRVGAEEASQTPDLPISPGVPVPANVLDAIDQQLASSGISACHVRLQHNVVPAAPPVFEAPIELSAGDCDCREPDAALPSAREYVRVTVGVRLTQLTPNLLRMFGFDVSDRIVQQTTTFRYEL